MVRKRSKQYRPVLDAELIDKVIKKWKKIKGVTSDDVPARLVIMDILNKFLGDEK